MLNIFGLVIGTEKGFMEAQKKEREQGISDTRRATNRIVSKYLRYIGTLEAQLFANRKH